MSKRYKLTLFRKAVIEKVVEVYHFGASKHAHTPWNILVMIFVATH